MSPREIKEIVAVIAREEVGLEGPLPEGDLDEHLDSLARLTLVVGIEDRFEIAFDPEDDQEIRTLDDVVATVARKLAGR